MEYDIRLGRTNKNVSVRHKIVGQTQPAVVFSGDDSHHCIDPSRKKPDLSIPSLCCGFCEFEWSKTFIIRQHPSCSVSAEAPCTTVLLCQHVSANHTRPWIKCPFCIYGTQTQSIPKRHEKHEWQPSEILQDWTVSGAGWLVVFSVSRVIVLHPFSLLICLLYWTAYLIDRPCYRYWCSVRLFIGPTCPAFQLLIHPADLQALVHSALCPPTCSSISS